MALLGITAGTLYQKRFVQPCDVRTANTVQLSAALLVTLPLALLEAEAMRWQLPDGSLNSELVGAMAWSVLGLTLGGSSLLYLLIQRGAAASVTSLMYLVPPCTALIAWLLFAEPITATTLAVFFVQPLVVTSAAARKPAGNPKADLDRSTGDFRPTVLRIGCKHSSRLRVLNVQRENFDDAVVDLDICHSASLVSLRNLNEVCLALTDKKTHVSMNPTFFREMFYVRRIYLFSLRRVV